MSKNQKYEIFKKIKGYRALCYINNEIMLSKKNKIYKYNIKNDKIYYLAKYNVKLSTYIILCSRLLSRIFRVGFFYGEKIDSHGIFILIFSNSILKFDINKKIILVEKNIEFGSRPLMIYVNEEKSEVIYGDYGNLDGKEIGIYKRDINGEWKYKRLFEAKQIDHIHGIFKKNDESFYLLTGDSDKSSGIWECNKDFSKIEPLYIGEQKYRTCSIYLNDDNIVYATDSQYKNNIIRYINKNIEEDIFELEGSCIYSKFSNNNLYFSTSVEPGTRFKSMILNLIDFKIGKGIKSRYCTIVEGNLKNGFKEIFRIKKDILPMGLCQFGSLSFINGQDKNGYLIFYANATKNDNTTYILKKK